MDCFGLDLLFLNWSRIRLIVEDEVRQEELEGGTSHIHTRVDYDESTLLGANNQAIAYRILGANGGLIINHGSRVTVSLIDDSSRPTSVWLGKGKRPRWS
jgi:hypothetical protein